MKSKRTCSAAALALVALVGCKKEGAVGPAEPSDLPPELQPHPVKVDVSKLAVPPLFASVPADTPYLMAGLEAVPVELYSKMSAAFGPLFEGLIRQLRDTAGDHDLFSAVLTELDGKWSVAGLESLGFSARPAFAIYGLGLEPVVARIEVKDHKAVQATIERIAARAGKSLPPAETKDGRSYWKIDDGTGPIAIVGLGDNQLFAAVGSRAAVDAQLATILGGARPAQNMADGKALKELMTRHGVGPHFVGFADTRRLAATATQAAGAQLSPACTADIDQLAGRIPRLVVGYSELTATRTAGGFIVELAPDLAAELRTLQVEIPGLGPVLSSKPAIGMSLGLDLQRGQKLAIAAAARLKQLGAACGIDALAAAGAAEDTLSGQLPAPLAGLSGGAFAIRDFAMPTGGNPVPSKLDAVAVIASPEAKALFARLQALDPQFKALPIQPDGKLHDLSGAAPLPFGVSAGVGDRAIVLASGEARAAAGEPLLTARAVGKAPLLAATYDYPKLFQIQMAAMGGTAALEQIPAGGFIEAIGKLFGRAGALIDVTPAGLRMWASLEIK